MINILVAADDTARLTQIARLVTDSGHYRVTRAHGRPSQIENRTDGRTLSRDTRAWATVADRESNGRSDTIA